MAEQDGHVTRGPGEEHTGGAVSPGSTVAALSLRFERVFLGKRSVLKDVTLDVERGTHVAILGRNGAGKTTLLRALVGLIPAQGSVTVLGAPLENKTAIERARLIAYVPQRSELQARLSVYDVVAQGRYAHRHGGPVHWFPLEMSHERSHDAAVQRALDMTDTDNLRERVFPELSGGEQRRVLLARALASEAPVIALDEPTAALDIAHALLFFEQLKTLTAHGRTVVTVLHNLHDAALWCDRALVVHNQTSFYTGAPDLPSHVVREVYGVDVIPGGGPAYRLATASDSGERNK
jgi:iron complex transport system ATP-binding protein